MDVDLQFGNDSVQTGYNLLLSIQSTLLLTSLVIVLKLQFVFILGLDVNVELLDLVEFDFEGLLLLLIVIIELLHGSLIEVFKPLYLILVTLGHLLLIPSQLPKLLLLILEFLFIEILQLLFALIVSDLFLIHILLIVVLLLSFFLLQILIHLVQLSQLLGLLLLHGVDLLHKDEVLLSQCQVHPTRLLLNLSLQTFLVFSPLFHDTFVDEDYLTHLILYCDALHICARQLYYIASCTDTIDDSCSCSGHCSLHGGTQRIIVNGVHGARVLIDATRVQGLTIGNVEGVIDSELHGLLLFVNDRVDLSDLVDKDNAIVTNRKHGVTIFRCLDGLDAPQVRMDALVAELLVRAEEPGRHAKHFQLTAIGGHHYVLEQAVC